MASIALLSAFFVMLSSVPCGLTRKYNDVVMALTLRTTSEMLSLVFLVMFFNAVLHLAISPVVSIRLRR